MVDLSNTQYNGEYIFSGTRTKTTTYKTTKDEEGNITVEYNGSQADTNYQRKTEVSLGVFEPVNITGEHVFGYHEKIQSVDANGNKLFTDKDGNEVYLDETTKQYFYTNPVDPANPEYQGETSDLTKQYKQAEDAAGNKKFEAEDGEYVYFDGANYLDEEGNAYTGDTSNLKKVYEYNSAGIFGALCELSSSLGRTINSAEHGNSEIQNIAQGEIRATLDKFETGMNNITTLQTKFGGVMNRLEMTSNTLDTNELNLKEYVSNLKDIDYTTAITEWLTAQYAYQASLTATSQSMNLSLLNYM